MSKSQSQIRHTLRAIKYKYSRLGFSESGEDLIARYLMGTKKGFFVDIGAGNPVVGSNSYLFYKSGWHGVAVDPNSKLSLAWKIARPKDAFLSIAIGSQSGNAIFYEYQNDLRSTISQKVHNYYETQNLVSKSSEVRIETLTYLFERFVKDEQHVFLSIDVEGQELDTLVSLDFTRFQPRLIAIENWKLPWLGENEIAKFLHANNYRLAAYSGLTAFYMKSLDLKNLLDSRPSI